MEKDKVFCNCGWKGQKTELLQAQHPFDENDIVYGCPACKGLDEIFLACDVEGCWGYADCGFPTPEGYRHTCGKHMREIKGD